jgi:hypothetical protein
MLSTGGASFIDSDGLASYNQKVVQNIAAKEAAAETELPAESISTDETS